MTAVGFLVAAALGTGLRWLATSGSTFNERMAGTFVVNVAGAFLLGLLAATSEGTMLIVGAGGLGALTTFSTFVSQVECIDREGRRRDAALYVAATLSIGIAAAWFGSSIA